MNKNQDNCFTQYLISYLTSLLLIMGTIGGGVLIPRNTNAGMQPGDLSRARADAENQADAMNRMREVMYREINNPTERRPGGGGGHIYHDYLMMQIVIAYRNLLTPPARGGRKAPIAEDINHLTRMLEEEAEQKARDLFQIVLTFAGERDYASDLVEMIDQRRQGQQVRGLAISALGDIDYAIAIPEFLDALSDTSGEPAPHHNPVEGRMEYIFPAQRTAAFALRDFGVPFQKVLDEGNLIRFVTDRGIAARVLSERAILSKCENQSSLLLNAIFRVGGVEARDTLEDLVRKNENDPMKGRIVGEAKSLLSQLLENQSTD